MALVKEEKAGIVLDSQGEGEGTTCLDPYVAETRPEKDMRDDFQSYLGYLVHLSTPLGNALVFGSLDGGGEGSFHKGRERRKKERRKRKARIHRLNI